MLPGRNNANNVAASAIANIRISRAGLLLDRQNVQRAIPLLQYALAVYEADTNRQNRATLHNLTAVDTQLAAAYARLNQLPTARQHLLTAQEMFKKHRLVASDLAITMAYTSARWHQKMGQWQAAFSQLSIADSMR